MYVEAGGFMASPFNMHADLVLNCHLVRESP
jgi:hypothetical protein